MGKRWLLREGLVLTCPAGLCVACGLKLGRTAFDYFGVYTGKKRYAEPLVGLDLIGSVLIGLVLIA